MAVINEFTVCSLCGEALDRPYMGLSFFIKGLPEKLWDYGDSAMHVDCFDKWEHRLDFSHASFTFHVNHWKNARALGYILLKTENYMLVCSAYTSPLSDRIPNYTIIFLRNWDLAFHTYSDMWDTFISGGYKEKLEGLSSKSKEEVISIIENIHKQIPDIQSLQSSFQEKNRKSTSNQ